MYREDCRQTVSYNTISPIMTAEAAKFRALHILALIEQIRVSPSLNQI